MNVPQSEGVAREPRNHRHRRGLWILLFVSVGAAVGVGAYHAVRPTLRRMAWERQITRDLSYPADYVGWIEGVDHITEEHVAALLDRNGIKCGIQGSVVYGITCPYKDVPRAVSILKADASAYGYEIELRGGWKTPEERVPKAVKRDVRRPLVEFIGAMESAGKKDDIVSLLRSKWVQADARDCPIVRSITIQKRPYVGQDGTEKVGCCVQLDLVRNGNDASPSSTAFYQVWDGGQKIHFAGGCRSGTTPSESVGNGATK